MSTGAWIMLVVGAVLSIGGMIACIVISALHGKKMGGKSPAGQ